ncbi:MAG: hypothetical protein K6U00_05410, partial [Armatimonadetes bacterium]|nr:hypothetical protein [Armatimonadota bacterium]
SPVWESAGWTTVYNGNVTISSTGWNEFIFQTPFAYNGSQNLMIDISFNNSSYTTDGLCRYTTASANRSIYYRTDSGYGDPLNWSGRTPVPNTATKVPNVRLKVKQPATPATVSSAKQMPDGTVVEISGAVVSAAWADYFYVEDENRSSGIRVEKSAHGLAAGTKVNVVGTLGTTADGERFISESTVSSVGSGVIKPLGMTNKSLGGGDIGNPGTGQGQRGVTGGVGLNNIGLLVQTTGIVTYIDEHTFTIDDGSGVNVRCETPESIIVSPTWQYVSVIGISSIRKNGENYERLLRVTAVPLIL